MDRKHPWLEPTEEIMKSLEPFRLMMERAEQSKKKIQKKYHCEIEDYKDHCDEGPWRSMLIFMWLTGCRASEATDLKWSDIDYDRNLIVLECGKNSKNGSNKRDFPITHDLSVLLHKMRLSGLYCFMVDGHTIDGNNLWQYAKHRLKRMGMGHLTPRGMRRTFATNLSDNRENAFLIQELMGHAKVETTLKYIQKNDSNSLNALKRIKR